MLMEKCPSANAPRLEVLNLKGIQVSIELSAAQRDSPNSILTLEKVVAGEHIQPP